jgi:hypothetical protein
MPNISGSDVPQVDVSLVSLSNEYATQIALGIKIDNKIAYTPWKAPASTGLFPVPMPNTSQSYSLVHQNYNAAVPTYSNYPYFTMEVAIATSNIPDYVAYFPKGLLITKNTYENILRHLTMLCNPKLAYLPFVHELRPRNRINLTTPDPLCCQAVAWKVEPLYQTLWACQSNGPLLLTEKDYLRFQVIFEITDPQNDNVRKNYHWIYMMMFLNGDPKDCPFSLQLQGKFHIKAADDGRKWIVHLTPRKLIWFDTAFPIG